MISPLRAPCSGTSCRTSGRRLDVYDFGEPTPRSRWCNTNRPDLLLLDYCMPGMDGLEPGHAFREAAAQPRRADRAGDRGRRRAIRQAALDAASSISWSSRSALRELRARCRNLLQLRQQSESVKQRALSLERLLASMHEVEGTRTRDAVTQLWRAIELRDTGTSAYLERMSHIAGPIAEGLGLPEERVRTIEPGRAVARHRQDRDPDRC